MHNKCHTVNLTFKRVKPTPGWLAKFYVAPVV